MKTRYSIPNYSFIFILLLSGLFSVYAQQNSEDIIDHYSDYTKAPREVTYVHLNKSTYIEGEMLGFTAYVFDMQTKKPSQIAQNLYCTISDAQGNIVKKKLLKIENGVVSNIFEIDSTLSTGIFTFKAYTNWMRNFKEQNHFEQTFKVIDADNKAVIKPISHKDLKIDLQVLGEGGHILYNVPNTIGIIAKNQFGRGIAKASGYILDNEGTIISKFRLNNVGIAKTIFTPQPNKTYSAELVVNETLIKTEISNIKVLGLALTLVEQREKVTLKIQTNTQTKEQFQNKILRLSLHDGNRIQVSEFQLNAQGLAIISYPTASLFSGINIFTIFNEANKPLLERLYFNTIDLNTNQIKTAKTKIEKDSLDLNLTFDQVDPSKWSSLSISVLPSKTKSYNHHNTLISQLYIQPFIKGILENSRQYFEEINKKSKYNLDLLMMTQGWSSYDWNAIFNYDDKYIYPFERGIDIVANINGEKSGTYVVYPLAQNNTQLFEISEKEKEFTIKGSFPNNEDLLRIGYLDTKKKEFNKKPSLYLQFYPSEFPNFKGEHNVIDEVYIENDTIINNTYSIRTGANIELLDEVVVEAVKSYTRAESLANKAINSRVEIINERDKLRNQRIDLYLERLGFRTQFDYFSGTLSIINPRVNWGTNVPLVYLDDALLSYVGGSSDFSLLSFLNTSDIDYIEYELYGVGGGIRGQAGFIKIYTSQDFKTKGAPNHVATYDVPLRFEKEQKFYAPKYQYYNTSFFNSYGTIDWKPKLKLDSNGSINFKIRNTGNETITLFVEGVLNDLNYISQKVIIESNN
jgi:hypothetical protein